MLKVIVPETEYYDESKEEFFVYDPVILELEHSLVSLSKWEQIYEIPFLESKEKTTEQVIKYIECMLLTSKIPENLSIRLSEKNFSEINEYIDSKMTATWFNDSLNTPKTNQVITSELIYYWMIGFEIPFECQYWHLNRLFTLIRVCGLKQAKPEKMSRSELAARNRALNEQRRKELGTKG